MGGIYIMIISDALAFFLFLGLAFTWGYMIGRWGLGEIYKSLKEDFSFKPKPNQDEEDLY